MLQTVVNGEFDEGKNLPLFSEPGGSDFLNKACEVFQSRINRLTLQRNDTEHATRVRLLMGAGR